jgi:DUF1365 family protein
MTTPTGTHTLPTAALSLVHGDVMHARMKPVAHRFDYRVFNIFIDLDRLDEADQAARLFSVNRFNLASFHVRDHGPCDGSSLRDYVNGLLSQADQPVPDRVLLWCYPRILGHVFNPIAVYFCANGDRITSLIYEVRNTFGDMHTYVAPITPDEIGAEGIKQSRDKLFHVSPFIEMAMRYHFRVVSNAESLKVRILETDATGPILSATFKGRPEPMTSRGLGRAFLRAPLLGIKVVGAIHYEAAKLWLKGVTYVPRPSPPALVSFNAAGPITLSMTSHPIDGPTARKAA